MLDPVDAHMRDDGPPVRFRGPKGFQTGIMSPEPAVRIKPGLFGCDAPLAQSTRRDILELAVAAMVQSEIVGAADRKKMFVKGDMAFRRTQGFISDEQQYEHQSLMSISSAVLCLKKHNNRYKPSHTTVHTK